MAAAALNGCENGLLSYMHGQVFVVSAHRACSPPFWEVAAWLETGCNSKLCPEHEKVASFVTSQERVGLLWPHCCLSLSKPQQGYFVLQLIFLSLFLKIRPNILKSGVFHFYRSRRGNTRLHGHAMIKQLAQP